MAAGLESRLSELHACFQGDPSVGGPRSYGIVGTIAHICLEDVSEKEIGNLAFFNLAFEQRTQCEFWQLCLFTSPV